MIQYKKISLLLIAIFLTFSNKIGAQTIETNISGLVIKNFRCGMTGTEIFADLINRNPQAFNGNLRTKIIDTDNDTVWQGTQKINVPGENGKSFMVNLGVGKCTPPFKVQITLEI